MQIRNIRVISLEFKEILYGTSEYELSLELRDDVLRKPLGRSIKDDDLSVDRESYHLGVFIKEELIASLVLTKVNDQQLKMRQVAVKENFQGKKVGKQLVEFAEDFAKILRFNEIILNSRKTAISFYEKQGYQGVGEEFLEVSIPHLKMLKSLKKSE